MFPEDTFPPGCVIIDENGSIETEVVFPKKLSFIGSGSWGIVFGDGNLCAKFMACTCEASDELNLSWEAGQKGIGPKLVSYGTVEMSKTAFKNFNAKRNSSDYKPIFFIEAEESDAVEFYFMCYEQWMCTFEEALVREATDESIRKILPKWKHCIEEIHALGIYHFDITPQNILVKMEGKNIVDLCIADYGIAAQKRDWFLNSRYTDKNRTDVINRFPHMPITSKLRKAIETSGKNTIVPVRNRFHYWMLHNPANIDYCIFAAMCHDLGVPELYPIYFPQSFNFSLPWNDLGFLTVELCARNIRQRFVICGFDSLALFRTNVETSSHLRIKKMHFLASDGIVSRAREATTFPSCVLRRSKKNGHVVFIKMV
jgi:hypothetical protein